MKFLLIEKEIEAADRAWDSLRVTPQKRRILNPVARKINKAVPDLLITPEFYELPLEEFKYVVNLASILSSEQNQVNYFGQILTPSELASIFFTSKDGNKSPLRPTGLNDHDDSDSMWAQVEYLSDAEHQEGPMQKQLKYLFDRDLAKYQLLVRKYGEYLPEELNRVLYTKLDSNAAKDLPEKEKELFTLLYNSFQQDTLFRRNIRVFLCNYAYDLIMRGELMDTEIKKITNETHDKNSPWLKYTY